MEEIPEIIEKTNAERLADGLWRLVNIPSPTGREQKAALAYADMLKQAGAEVELDEFIPDSPAVIGHLRGNRPGKCLQLAGHIDTIDNPHPQPERHGNIISGRGSADMKNGLAAVLEVVTVLNDSGCDFPGRLLITAYGQHETPLGNQQPLIRMLENGVKGDAAIVTESFSDSVVTAAKGQAIWNIVLRRKGQVCHELCRTPEMDKLLAAVIKLLDAIGQKNNELSAAPHNHPNLGPESLFIGQIHYGDFYNRVPNECRLQGTYRWHPNHSFEQVQKDFAETLDKTQLADNVSVELSWILSGDSYEVDPDQTIIQSLLRAITSVTGKQQPTAGTSVITDACRIAGIGNIPVAVLGFDNETAHADYEFVRIDRMYRSCRILLYTVLDYLNRTEDKR